MLQAGSAPAVCRSAPEQALRRGRWPAVLCGGREGGSRGRASALGLAVKIAACQASSGAELWLRGRGAFAALQTLRNACSCLGGSLCVAVNLYFFKSDCFIDQNIGRPVLWYRGLGFFFF